MWGGGRSLLPQTGGEGAESAASGGGGEVCWVSQGWRGRSLLSQSEGEGEESAASGGGGGVCWVSQGLRGRSLLPQSEVEGEESAARSTTSQFHQCSEKKKQEVTSETEDGGSLTSSFSSGSCWRRRAAELQEVKGGGERGPLTLKMVVSSSDAGVCLVACFQGIWKSRWSGLIHCRPGNLPLFT